MFIVPYEKGWTVYTKSNCVYCDRAKSLLENQSAIYINCDEWLIDHKESFLNYMKDQIGREYKLFPMIFYNGTFIGGYTESKEYIEKMVTFAEEF
jgi:glutaredoxin